MAIFRRDPHRGQNKRKEKRRRWHWQGCWPGFAIALWRNRTPESASSRHWNRPTCVFSGSQPCLRFISCFRAAFQRSLLYGRIAVCERRPCYRFFFFSLSLSLSLFFCLTTPSTKTRMPGVVYNVLWIHGTCVSLFLFFFLILLSSNAKR